MANNKENNNKSNNTLGPRPFEGMCKHPDCKNKISFSPHSTIFEMSYCSDKCHLDNWLKTGLGLVHPKFPHGPALSNTKLSTEVRKRKYNDKHSELYFLK